MKELVTGVFTVVLRTNIVVKYLIKSSAWKQADHVKNLGVWSLVSQKLGQIFILATCKPPCEWDWDSISFYSSPTFQIREFLDPIHMGQLLGI